MPPSSAGVSSYEDQANSYNHYPHSAALDHWLAAPGVGDGDARHIAMKGIRMRRRSQSVQLIVMLNQINANYSRKLRPDTPLAKNLQFFDGKAFLGSFPRSQSQGQPRVSR